MGMLKVVIKKVGEPARVETIQDDYKVMQGLVGGGCIETVSLSEVLPRVLVVCNDEGKLIGLKPNICLGQDLICGDIFITKFDGVEDFTSLTNDDVNRVISILNEKEFFLSIMVRRFGQSDFVKES